MSQEPSDIEIESLLDRLDGSGSDNEWEAVEILRKGLGETLPTLLLNRFSVSSKWSQRASLVYHAIKYARQSEDAVKLGLLAVEDRSKIVRYRGCMLLACSLRKDIVSTLRHLSCAALGDTKADLLAAIDAIEHDNQNYFVDRDHSGLVELKVA